MKAASVEKAKKYKPKKQPLTKRLVQLLAVVCDVDSMYHLLCTDLLCADGGFCSCI